MRSSAVKIEQAVERAFAAKSIILRPDGSAETDTQAVAEVIIEQI